MLNKGSFCHPGWMLVHSKQQVLQKITKPGSICGEREAEFTFQVRDPSTQLGKRKEVVLSCRDIREGIGRTKGVAPIRRCQGYHSDPKVHGTI